MTPLYEQLIITIFGIAILSILFYVITYYQLEYSTNKLQKKLEDRKNAYLFRKKQIELKMFFALHPNILISKILTVYKEYPLTRSNLAEYGIYGNVLIAGPFGNPCDDSHHIHISIIYDVDGSRYDYLVHPDRVLCNSCIVSSVHWLDSFLPILFNK